MSKSRPVLYLDIDDVLNCTNGDAIAKEKYSAEADLLQADLYANKEQMYKFWYQEAVDSLRIILDEIEPDIFIHSTWKYHFSADEFKDYFKFWGLNDKLIKGIVTISNPIARNTFLDLSHEIDELNHNNYVVIDDQDMPEHKRYFSHHIKVDSKTGLTKENADQAIELFKKWKEKIEIPKSGFKKFIIELAEEYDISYKSTVYSKLASDISRLSGDEGEPDYIEQLIIALRKEKVLNAIQMRELLQSYLKESMNRSEY